MRKVMYINTGILFINCIFKRGKFSFRVISYNILADTYADSDFSKDVLYPYCPQYALDMDYRKQLILKEIIGKVYKLSIKV